ncbi:MAG: GspB domain-containing protein [bacterium]|nr:GspB domain-containing protein [bacterium]
MSSILRALKKLEEESTTGDGPSNEQKIQMQRVVHRRAGTSRTINRFLFIVSALLLLSIAGWLLLKSPSPPPLKSGRRPHPINEPPPQPIVEKPSQPEKAPAKIKPVEIKKAAVERVEKSVPPPQPIPKKVVTAEEPVRETNRPQLNLTGILWSEKPGKRLALINDRYFKEGETINGISVLQIEKKTVTFQSGEEKWTIRLKK